MGNFRHHWLSSECLYTQHIVPGSLRKCLFSLCTWHEWVMCDVVWTIAQVGHFLSAAVVFIFLYFFSPFTQVMEHELTMFCIVFNQWNLTLLIVFWCCSELNSKLQDTLEMIDESMDVALSKTCVNFDEAYYSRIQTAYRLLGKTQACLITEFFSVICRLQQLCRVTWSVLGQMMHEVYELSFGFVNFRCEILFYSVFCCTDYKFHLFYSISYLTRLFQCYMYIYMT